MSTHELKNAVFTQTGLESSRHPRRELLLEFWQRFEALIPMGEESATVAELRAKAPKTTGDERAINEMALFRFYNEAAKKQRLLAPLLHYVARERFREALRSAKYYPDPLELHAAFLAKQGDFAESAKEYEDVIPRRRAWTEVFKDPDGSRKLQLCWDLAVAGVSRSLLGQFNESLFWNMEAFKEFNELTADVRVNQLLLEDSILAGITRSLIAQFRYADALAFIEQILASEVLTAYRSDVRRDFHAQKELLPELVSTTRGYQFPEEGIKLWANLMEEVQRCKSPDDARETRRKIFDKLDLRETAGQIRDLEDAIVKLLNADSGKTPQERTIHTTPSAAVPPLDFSGIDNPESRKAFEEAMRAAESLRQHAERRQAEIAELVRKIDESMDTLRQIGINQVHDTASMIYHVPDWFRSQWNLRAVALLAVKFLAIEFAIGKLLEKLLTSGGTTVAERLHFSLSEGLISLGVVILLFFLSMPGEKRIDDAFLKSYKRLLQKLVSDRVTIYWVTYNTLLKTYIATKAKIDKLKSEVPADQQRE